LKITKDRKKRVIDLYFNQHKTYAEIAEIEKISPRDIHAIIKEEQARRQKYKQQEISAQAYKLFSEGKTPVEVAVILNLPASKVSKLYIEYWKLRGLDKLYTIYKETNGKIWIVLKLYKELIKKRRMSIDQVANAVDTDINRLPHMESLYEQVKDQVDKMQRTIQRLANDIRALERKISILDKIVFSSEQERKRKEQQVQELTAKKDRLEKLITNVLHGEGYSKLNQLLKENVKAVLSEKRVLISISFAAVIQTLKADPQMIKLIQNITGANDGEQHKDNHINITQYFESNKDRILNLGEKTYENVVEELTNNTISCVAATSSTNPTSSSLSQSSSTFPSLSNQSDTHRKEDQEIYDDSKDDIAD
jgi:DNA-binding CsgD family transcriptional regulator